MKKAKFILNSSIPFLHVVVEDSNNSIMIDSKSNRNGISISTLLPEGEYKVHYYSHISNDLMRTESLHLKHYGVNYWILDKWFAEDVYKKQERIYKISQI